MTVQTVEKERDGHWHTHTNGDLHTIAPITFPFLVVFFFGGGAFHGLFVDSDHFELNLLWCIECLDLLGGKREEKNLMMSRTRRQAKAMREDQECRKGHKVFVTATTALG